MSLELGQIIKHKMLPELSENIEIRLELINDKKQLRITSKNDHGYMFMSFFSRAQKLADGEDYDSEQGKRDIAKILELFVSDWSYSEIARIVRESESTDDARQMAIREREWRTHRRGVVVSRGITPMARVPIVRRAIPISYG